MVRHKRLLTLTAIAASAALALTGCSSGGGSDNANEGSSNKEIVFIDGIGANPQMLNPQLSTDVTTRQVAGSMFDTLIVMDGEYNLQPALAESWEANEDATEFTLHLRDDVTWHDGEPFTSADVKFNLEEVLKLHPLGAILAKAQASIEAPDDYTVVIHLAEPFAAYLEGLSSHYMLPAHLYAGTDVATNALNLTPVGTGPFKFEEFEQGAKITVVRNDDYWGEMTDIDKVIFQIMPDMNARMLALQSGEVDRLTDNVVDTAQIETIAKDGDFYLNTVGTPATMTLFFNVRNEGPIADPAVRAALYSAIDREALRDNVFYGQGETSRGPIPASIGWAIDPKIDFNKQFAFDPDAAGKALDAAGYAIGDNGKRFEINIHVAAGLSNYTPTAESIKSSLEEIGVGVNIVGEDINVFADQVFKQHNFDMAILSFGAYEDPSLGVARLYICNTNDAPFRNATGVCDPETDAAFAAASSVTDREERRNYFAAAEKRAGELVATMPLLDTVPISIVRQDRWDNVEEFASRLTWNWSALRSK